MAQQSSAGGLIAAALILGGSLLGGSYLVSASIDRGATELAALSGAIKTAASAQQVAARPTPTSNGEIE